MIMALSVNRESQTADRLRTAIRIRRQIDRLERRFAKLFAHMPKYVLVRNGYGLTPSEMKKIAQKLHGKAKQRIASGRSKEFRGSIEEVL
jgi:hypothetical protein